MTITGSAAEREYMRRLVIETGDLIHRALLAGDPALAEFYKVRGILAAQRLVEILRAEASTIG